MPTGEFRYIAVEGLGTHFMISAVRAAFQRCPEAFNAVRMRLAFHVLSHDAVFHRFVIL